MMKTLCISLVAFYAAFAMVAPAGGQTSSEQVAVRADLPDLCTAREAAWRQFPSEEKLLVQLTCSALDAVNRRDRSALAALMADAWLVTTVSGKTMLSAKSYVLDAWTRPLPAGTKGVSRLIEVRASRIQGATGYVVGLILDRTTTVDSDECLTHAFTDIWQKIDGRWQWVASHESGLVEGPCAK